MPVFLRVAIYATLAFLIVEVLPLAWMNFVLCWIILVAAAYRYPHMILARVQTMSSAVGFSIGMGAALGAIVNTVGMIASLIFHSMFAMAGIGMAGDHGQNTVGSTVAIANSMTMMGDVAQIFSAPFVGAVLGLIGGLIGGSTIPKAGMMVPGDQVG